MEKSSGWTVITCLLGFGWTVGMAGLGYEDNGWEQRNQADDLVY